jgi:uncharacterized protein (DUF1501 family)
LAGRSAAAVYGQWPGLEQQLFERRDLAVTTDFRECQVTGERHLRRKRNRFFGYKTANTLGLMG